MSDEPEIDPAIIDAPRTMRFCPQCSAKKYQVDLDMQGDVVKCLAIECKVCGFDILGAYRSTTLNKRRSSSS